MREHEKYRQQRTGRRQGRIMTAGGIYVVRACTEHDPEKTGAPMQGMPAKYGIEGILESRYPTIRLW